MISFKVIEREDLISPELFLSKDAQTEEIFDYFAFLSDTLYDDTEIAVSQVLGAVVVRIFDMGRYFFSYPMIFSDGCDIKKVLSEIAFYAARQEIELTIIDFPGENLSELSSFRHINLDAAMDGCFVATVKTECSLLEEIPEHTMGRVTLNEIQESDIPEYARLSKDENVNKYWGYDYRDDTDDPSDEYFYEQQIFDFKRGVALSLAVRCENRFVGEAIIYGFIGNGEAEISIRLLPEYMGKGIGSETLTALTELSAQIGLCKLKAFVCSENEASVALCRGQMNEVMRDDEGRVLFVLEI